MRKCRDCAQAMPISSNECATCGGRTGGHEPVSRQLVAIVVGAGVVLVLVVAFAATRNRVRDADATALRPSKAATEASAAARLDEERRQREVKEQDEQIARAKITLAGQLEAGTFNRPTGAGVPGGHQGTVDRGSPEERAEIAEQIDTYLLTKHMSPDGVAAIGDGRRTLQIRGWFCSRQMMFDLQQAGFYEKSRAVGFRRIECATSLDTSWVDL